MMDEFKQKTANDVIEAILQESLKLNISNYGVVAVLNEGAGPDEQRIEVLAIEWDYQLGQLRLILP